jgi:hypothetical protein
MYHVAESQEFRGRGRGWQASMACISRWLVGPGLGVGPEVQGVAAAAALEAVEDLVAGVDRGAAGGAGSRAVQGAWPTLLGAVNAQRSETEQAEDSRHVHGGADGGKVDGGTISDTGLTLPGTPALVLGLADELAAFTGLDELAIALGEDVEVTAGEPIRGREVADGAVQTDVVVIVASPSASAATAEGRDQLLLFQQRRAR